mmetsp:Transcript_6913/g.24587  ORF Transcript_6913/g.24587 Transcript_6913/m.24587 type:complete len:181 (-) Transcript_6913:1258-1800(-)
MALKRPLEGATDGRGGGQRVSLEGFSWWTSSLMGIDPAAQMASTRVTRRPAGPSGGADGVGVGGGAGGASDGGGDGRAAAATARHEPRSTGGAHAAFSGAIVEDQQAKLAGMLASPAPWDTPGPGGVRGGPPAFVFGAAHGATAPGARHPASGDGPAGGDVEASGTGGAGGASAGDADMC